jgi:tRNA (cytidine/uridine-2'-O-)-methyltransferase
VKIVLYQPDIPQNTGTILRLGACLGIGVAVIGPAGFDLSDKALRRAGLDYIASADIDQHASWAQYDDARNASGGRLVLLSAHASELYHDFHFRTGDHLLLGRESAGVPAHVHAAADARLRVPMRSGFRSLNIAVCAAMVLGEALRQTNGFPHM